MLRGNDWGRNCFVEATGQCWIYSNDNLNSPKEGVQGLGIKALKRIFYKRLDKINKKYFAISHIQIN